MEEVCRALSEKLSEAEGDKYTVFYEEELLASLPEGMRTRAVLDAALKKLSDEDCVSVKCVRGNAFCLSFIKNYSPAPHLNSEQKMQLGGEYALTKRNFAAIILSAFAGGLLSGLVVAIVGLAL